MRGFMSGLVAGIACRSLSHNHLIEILGERGEQLKER